MSALGNRLTNQKRELFVRHCEGHLDMAALQRQTVEACSELLQLMSSRTAFDIREWINENLFLFKIVAEGKVPS